MKVINKLNESGRNKLKSFILRNAKEAEIYDLAACERSILEKDWDFNDPKCSVPFELSARESKIGATVALDLMQGDFEIEDIEQD